jgi:hypothetical protein
MSGAGDESRTRDLNLGKVALYQLSYSRMVLLTTFCYLPLLHKAATNKTLLQKSGAGDESRTRDLNLGKVALYQLSYSRVLLPLLPICYLLRPGVQNCSHRRNEIMYKPLKRVNPFHAGL